MASERVVSAWLWVLTAAAPLAGAAPQYFIETVAGSNDIGDGGPAVSASFEAAEGLAVDSRGNIYIADTVDNRVRMVDSATGLISTVAGSGAGGFAGDGGPASQALLDRPYDVAVDSAGNIYIADLGNARIRRVSPGGIIETVAGGGDAVVEREMAALAARLRAPRNLALDASGNLYIAEFEGHRVLRLTSGARLSPFAGTGAAGYNGEGFATLASLSSPAGLWADEQGRLYIADSGNNRIRLVSGRYMETVLDQENANLFLPVGVAAGRDGALYVISGVSGEILRRSPSGELSAIRSFASLARPRDLAAGKDGSLYIAENHQTIRLDPAGKPERVAGTGSNQSASAAIPATKARLLGPIGVAVDNSGVFFVAEESRQRVVKVDSLGYLRPLPNKGLADPVAAAVDPRGGVWVADYQGSRLHHISTSGAITVAAGDGKFGYAGDGGLAAAARFNRPRGIAADRFGSLFVADSLNHRIRKISPAGIVTTVAGSGARGFSGDSGLAVNAALDTPTGVAVDGEGSLYIAEQGNHTIRKVEPTGFIFTVAGTGRPGYQGDGQAATEAQLSFPSAVAVDPEGVLFIADTGNHRIRMVAGGVIATIAGDGAAGLTGDGGPAEFARFRSPSSVALDLEGRLYVADLDNRRIRRLTPVLSPPAAVVEDCLVLHGATLQQGPVAPGQIVAIFGSGLGPVPGVAGTMNDAGLMPNLVAGAEVRIGRFAAGLFYVGENQINARVPDEVAGLDGADLEILRNGTTRCRARVEIAPAAPGLFTIVKGTGQAAALNEDGTLNSAENPAHRGSIVVLFGTGDGTARGAPATVEVRVAGSPVDILYAGAAPGYPGLMQINIRLSGSFLPSGNLAIELIAGSASSQPGVTIAVR